MSAIAGEISFSGCLSKRVEEFEVIKKRLSAGRSALEKKEPLSQNT